MDHGPRAAGAHERATGRGSAWAGQTDRGSATRAAAKVPSLLVGEGALCQSRHGDGRPSRHGVTRRRGGSMAGAVGRGGGLTLRAAGWLRCGPRPSGATVNVQLLRPAAKRRARFAVYWVMVLRGQAAGAVYCDSDTALAQLIVSGHTWDK